MTKQEVEAFARQNPAAFKDIVDALGFGVSNREFAASVEKELEARYTASLRDEFAMAALGGMLTSPHNDDATPEMYARASYEVADAMLVEREERK